ncbi:unnamed protein product [Ostreobium quekettii]|uniref:GRF-type domain-containing protein n=1 Tax=Ostreobium quekettii TaxID=121088 RepID=A0A8S1J4M9_9CHLO|nr:unnamed protein product [Ostreobium quekettii]|eukprot:evm.model.scf_2286.1 EVM.evm.TU.scf_2286.1   scf_2286:4690-7590(+)
MANMREPPVGLFLSCLGKAGIESFHRLPSLRQTKLASEKFDYFVVYDFEATCNKSKQLIPQELIEFSCVVVDGHSLDILPISFQEYVRPSVHPVLDPFCVELTGISQAQVDDALPLQAVLQRHEQWLEDNGVLAEGKAFTPVTWTDWDLEVQLEMECRWRCIKKPSYFDRWINLKKVFIRHCKRSFNLKMSVEYMRLKWQGRCHCGLDDATNTARLAVRLIHDGAAMEITGAFQRRPKERKQAPRQVQAKLLPQKRQAAITPWLKKASKRHACKDDRSSPCRDSSVAGRHPSCDSIDLSGICPPNDRDRLPNPDSQDLVVCCAAREAHAGTMPTSTASCPMTEIAAQRIEQMPAMVENARGFERSEILKKDSEGCRTGPLAPLWPSQEGVKHTDDKGHINAVLCRCGVPAKQRQVKKPGINLGRRFLSCGKWRIRGGEHCDFFSWDDECIRQGSRVLPEGCGRQVGH